MRDALTTKLERMMNQALRAVRPLVAKKRKPQNSRGPLDEREQRRKEMLRKKLPLPGQMELFPRAEYVGSRREQDK